MIITRHLQSIMGDPQRGDGYDKDGRPGDCWRTVIACLMAVPNLHDVPHFVEMDIQGTGGNWWEAAQSFIKERTDCQQALEIFQYPQDTPNYCEYVIANGPSPRGAFNHVVITDRAGNLIHDPHPSQAGLSEITETYALVNLS